MDVGSFTTGMLTGLREGVEAALVISIILAYLARTGNRGHFAQIWAGAGIAVVLSIAVGMTLYLTVGGLPAPYEQIFEALTMLAAAGVVTWMLFWMRRQSAMVKGELHAALDRALSQGSVFALIVLAFTAVIREGLETALFLVGQAASASESALAVLAGAVAGLGVAALLGVGFYRGARVLNLRTFFRWTGIALIFIAGGLLARAVHELVEVGVITVGTQVAFDLSSILPHEAIDSAPAGIVLFLGQVLRAVFGYTSQPEVITFVAWFGYVVAALVLYLRPVKARVAVPAPAEASTGTSTAS